MKSKKESEGLAYSCVLVESEQIMRAPSGMFPRLESSLRSEEEGLKKGNLNVGGGCSERRLGLGPRPWVEVVFSSIGRVAEHRKN